MSETVGDVMTRDPVTVSSDSTVVEVARLMRDRDIGPVLVVDGDRVSGVVTDRDIVVRAVADGRDPGSVRVADICTSNVEAVSPRDSIEERRTADGAAQRPPAAGG